MMVESAATATSCVPSNMEVIGDAFCVWGNCVLFGFYS